MLKSNDARYIKQWKKLSSIYATKSFVDGRELLFLDTSIKNTYHIIIRTPIKTFLNFNSFQSNTCHSPPSPAVVKHAWLTVIIKNFCVQHDRLVDIRKYVCDERCGSLINASDDTIKSARTRDEIRLSPITLSDARYLPFYRVT